MFLGAHGVRPTQVLAQLGLRRSSGPLLGGKGAGMSASLTFDPFTVVPGPGRWRVAGPTYALILAG